MIFDSDSNGPQQTITIKNKRYDRIICHLGNTPPCTYYVDLLCIVFPYTMQIVTRQQKARAREFVGVHEQKTATIRDAAEREIPFDGFAGKKPDGVVG